VAALCGKYLTDFAELWQINFAFLIVAQCLTFFWLSQVTHSFFSRRQERAADAGAVALTGDPEAYISMLVKISQLNFLPLEWGRWNETWMTHPSTMRRIEAVARRGQLSTEQLREIMRSLEDEIQAPPSESVSDKYMFSSQDSV
jgi:Zn-dependent protease with chaperone function